MPINNSENILKIMQAYNAWWKSGRLSDELHQDYKRTAYYEISSRLFSKDLRRSVVLTGSRRVGKTTILYQLIADLLKSGIEAEKILYLSLDHPLLRSYSLGEILEFYHLNINESEECYLFLDEIQSSTDWSFWLKTIYDTASKTKVVATGSASSALQKGAEESGVGRWTLIHVPTLSFFEYCELLGVNEPSEAPKVKPTELINYSQTEFTKVMNKLLGLDKHFHRYLKIGGFPELALAENDFMAQTLIREDVIEKVLKKDIPSLYNIRNTFDLERIFLYLCYNSSSIIAMDAVAKVMEGISRATVSEYIKHMESANLIYLSYPVEMTGKKVLKAKPKIYVADAALRNALLMDDDLLTDSTQLGIAVETSVYKHIAAFYFQKATRLGYYREAKTGNEIDIVVDSPAGKILAEVKYRESAKLKPTDALYKLADEGSTAILITKRAEDYGKQESAGKSEILRIPAFAFLYLLGSAERDGVVGEHLSNK
ncbi:MAG: ATP-binding protein [Anaerovoracaceae bacterium]